MPSSGSSQPRTAGVRPHRSKKERPCDTCRKRKHLCMIGVRGQPCRACQTLNKACTFNLPPRPKRGPKGKEPEIAQQKPPSTILAQHAIENSEEDTWDSIVVNLQQDGVVDDNGSEEESNEPIDAEGEIDYESHFLGSGSFMGLTIGDLNTASSFPSSEVSHFRQVSRDISNPVWFMQNQSFIYGHVAPEITQQAYQNSCQTARVSFPAEALKLFFERTLPAWPILNAVRLEALCRAREGPAKQRFPHSLLTGILAHSTSYISSIRPHHKELWRQGLAALEAEYQQPRLQTIQLAILVITSRPNENNGQNTIALSRAIGAAQLLGLHMDPSKWKLPRWERSVRKRVWWTLMIHDKWRALLHGRPSCIHSGSFNVSLPTIYDADWGENASPGQVHSFESFIGMCRMTLLVDTLLSEIHHGHRVNPRGEISRIIAIESVINGFESLINELPADSDTVPTGVKSMRLSCLGMFVVLSRLILEAAVETSTWQLQLALHKAIKACQDLINFITHLPEHSFLQFWLPYSSYHLSNCAGLLVQVHINASRMDASFQQLAKDSLQALFTITAIMITYYRLGWDVAHAALARLQTLLAFTVRECPSLNSVRDEICNARVSAPHHPTNPSQYDGVDRLAPLDGILGAQNPQLFINDNPFINITDENISDWMQMVADICGQVQ